jgi:glycosyltransferase involved in cell wall biosynthesis
MHKKLSVIIPVYNAAAYLDRCMENLVEQSMASTDYEIILVDDGSPDDSGDICENYSGSYNFITTIHQENAGPAAARNAGLDLATGEYVAFIDPDDIVEKMYLEVAYAQAVHFGSDIVIFDAYRERVKGDETETEKWSHAPYSFNTTSREDIMSMQRQILYPYMAARVDGVTMDKHVPLAAPWDKVYRRSFLVAKGLRFPEELRVLDDMCFNFEAFGEAHSISYIPTFLYHYRVEETSITNSYKADRPQQDMKVFEHLKDSINGMGFDRVESERFRQALYARIIKSFAISMRLYFFNPKNPKSGEEILEELRNYMDTMPYKLAFKGIQLGNLEPKLKVVTMACRLKKPGALRTMYRLQYGKS